MHINVRFNFKITVLAIENVGFGDKKTILWCLSACSQLPHIQCVFRFPKWNIKCKYLDCLITWQAYV